MGLSDLSPFDPKKKVIEYVMEDEGEAALREKLIRMSVKDFAYETASESPAPGGGSVSALVGALGAALATMVANLSAGKRGWDDRWEEFSRWAEKGQEIMRELLRLVDEDTRAFNRIMEAYALPKSSPEEIATRSAAIGEATLNAAQVPLETMKAAAKVLPIAEAMARDGNPNSSSDAGVASLAARAAIRGAALNVRINADSLEDRCLAEKLIKQAEEIEATLK